ncbi:MAG: hypothetical protein EZS28_044425 [Streblomastix strix]|uniref:Uncharacterized protein n=1 Tax=Streblomastix strix TaxID=222440 RepID=A0A5J4TP58_9EUKA|nr:MAG: hypothetical protein EZS28_044425 [Streblomastix strix]
MNFDQEVQPDIAQADEEITRKILLIAQKIPNCSVQEQTTLLIKLVDIVSYVVRDGNLKLLIQNIKDSNIINIIRDSVNTDVKQLRIARNSLFSILFSFPFRHNVFIDANLTEFFPTKNLKTQIQDLSQMKLEPEQAIIDKHHPNQQPDISPRKNRKSKPKRKNNLKPQQNQIQPTQSQDYLQSFIEEIHVSR